MQHGESLPPTLAFDANSKSLRENPSSLPMPRVRAKCTPIWMEEKRKREGAVAMTILMLPAAPTAAKNIWQVKHQPGIRIYCGCCAGVACHACMLDMVVLGRLFIICNSDAADFFNGQVSLCRLSPCKG